MRSLLLLLPIAAFGAATNVQWEATPTQIVVRYDPPSSEACPIKATDSAGNVFNDTNASLFPGSDSDATRKIDGGNGRRIVVLGARRAEASGTLLYSRALPADSEVVVSVCGSEVKARTARLSGMVPDALPFNLSGHGYFGVPSLNWADLSKPTIDPQTGVKYWAVANGKQNGHQRDWAFTRFVAPGWNSPGNLLQDSTDKGATSSGAGVAFVSFAAVGKENIVGGYAAQSGYSLLDSTGNSGFTLNDVQVRVHGSGASATPDDRQVKVCRSVDSGQSCFDAPILVTLPQKKAATLTVPEKFPQPGFVGWGGRAIPREYLPVYGLANLNGSTLTIGAPVGGQAFGAHTFKQEWRPGSQIFIAESQCPSNLCKIVSVTSPTVLTIAETGTLNNVAWAFHGAGIRVEKANANGTVKLSLGYRVSANISLSQPEEEGCSAIEQVAQVDRAGKPSAPKPGFLCYFRDYLRGAQRLYWLAKDDPADARLISLLRIPTSIPGHNAKDLPAGGGFSLTYGNAAFDSADPKIIYTSLNTPNGRALFRLTYSGNLREVGEYLLASSGAVGESDNVFKWENISRGNSLTSQVLALPAYKAAFWGPAPNLAFQGIARGKAIFTWTPFSQDLASWIFSFDVATSKLEHGWNTLNSIPKVSFAGLHTTKISDLVILQLHSADKGAGGGHLRGPFTAAVSHVKKNGAWSTNTALPFPPDASYDSACPAGLAEEYVKRGATGKNCVQVRLAAEPCSATASAAEKAAFPCPTDPNKSWKGSALEPGNVIFDAAKGTDAETLMIVKREDGGTPADPSDDTYTLLRDQWNGYGCMKNYARGRVCLDTESQGVHATGWTATMYPFAKDVVWNPVTNTITEIPGDRTRGHYEFVPRPGNMHSFVSVATDVNFNPRYFSQVDVAEPDYATSKSSSSVAYQPLFAGANTKDIFGSVQSYGATPSTACGENLIWCQVGTDWRHLNSPYGSAGEIPGQGIGTTRTASKVAGNVYKISAISGASSKAKVTWFTIGPYVFRDMSSAATGDVITDANEGKFCVPRAVNECRTGSAVGELYYVIANADTKATQCWGSSGSGRVACGWNVGGVQGQVMQMRYGADDPTAARQRALGLNLTPPQFQYVYSKARPFPSGQKVMATVHNLEGNYTLPVIIDPGRWPEESAGRNTFLAVKVEAKANIVVEFGYEEFGARDAFFCTTRQERCLAKAAAVSEANPFLYASEPGADKAVSATVTVPGLPGRVLYYRVISGGVPSPLQVLALP